MATSQTLAFHNPHSSIMVSEKSRQKFINVRTNKSKMHHIQKVSQSLCLMLVIYYSLYCLVLFQNAPEQCREGHVKHRHSMEIINVVSFFLEMNALPSIKHAYLYLNVLVYIPDHTVYRLWSKGCCRITRVYGLKWTDLSLWDFGMLELMKTVSYQCLVSATCGNYILKAKIYHN